MGTKSIWGGAFTASLACAFFFQAVSFAEVTSEDIGPRFTMEYLSGQWEIEEKVEQLAVRVETEKATLEVDRQMWNMAERIYQKQAMSKEAYLTYRAKFETTAALVEELKAQRNYLAAYSLLFGYRVKTASAGKVGNLEYAKAFVELWKAQREFNVKALDRYRHEYELQQWVHAAQVALHKKGASAKHDVLTSQRKMIVAHENILFHQRRLPIVDCIIGEYKKMVDANGNVDPNVHAKAPCKSDLRPSPQP